MKRKLSLKEVQVRSFVTSTTSEQNANFKGGVKVEIPTLDHRCLTGNYPSINAACTA